VARNTLEGRRAYRESYRATNLEKMKSYAHAYYISHQEKVKTRVRANYVVNREKILSYAKEYREEHEEEVKAYQKSYRSVHKEKLNTYSRSYGPTHKSERNARGKIHYAESKVVEIVCIQCGKPAKVTIKASGKFCSQNCLRLSQTGPNSPTWNGGTSFEPYCQKFNDEFKNRVKAFFGYSCLICDAHENLCVHHVDYNKEACCDDKQPAFACVCNRHNSKANHSRDRWRYMFHYIIDEMYNGKCYFSKEEYQEMMQHEKA
jgi:hypothetical protein